jgi:hypothetical protein
MQIDLAKGDNMSTKSYCDNCGSETGENGHNFKLEFYDVEYILGYKSYWCEMCDNCFDEFVRKMSAILPELKNDLEKKNESAKPKHKKGLFK